MREDDAGYEEDQQEVELQQMKKKKISDTLTVERELNVHRGALSFEING